MKAEPRELRGRGKHVDLDAFAQSTENLRSLPPSMHAAIKMSVIRYTHIRTKICRIYRVERYTNFLEPKPSCCQRLLWTHSYHSWSTYCHVPLFCKKTGQEGSWWRSLCDIEKLRDLKTKRTFHAQMLTWSRTRASLELKISCPRSDVNLWHGKSLDKSFIKLYDSKRSEDFLLRSQQDTAFRSEIQKQFWRKTVMTAGRVCSRSKSRWGVELDEPMCHLHCMGWCCKSMQKLKVEREASSAEPVTDEKREKGMQVTMQQNI